MTTDKRGLTFTGGLAALETPQRSTSGASRSSEGALCSITFERVSTSICMSTSKARSASSDLRPNFLRYHTKFGTSRPLVLAQESITGTLFNRWSTSAMWFALFTWGELSMADLLRSVDANGDDRLQSSFAGTLSRAVGLGLLSKKGKKIQARYKVIQGADQTAIAGYMSFRPTVDAIEAARARAAKRKRARHASDSVVSSKD